jgi:hypothetical protein
MLFTEDLRGDQKLETLVNTIFWFSSVCLSCVYLCEPLCLGLGGSVTNKGEKS